MRNLFSHGFSSCWSARCRGETDRGGLRLLAAYFGRGWHLKIRSKIRALTVTEMTTPDKRKSDKGAIKAPFHSHRQTPVLTSDLIHHWALLSQHFYIPQTLQCNSISYSRQTRHKKLNVIQYQAQSLTWSPFKSSESGHSDRWCSDLHFRMLNNR